MSVQHSTESWKEIPGFTGYEVSTHGRVRSFWARRGNWRTGRTFVIGSSPHILKPRINRGGYRCVDLILNPGSGKRVAATVSRLVLTAFVRSPKPGELALHKNDPDKGNNRLDNLEWGYKPQNNGEDVVRHRGQHPCSPLTPDDVRSIREMLAAGQIQREIAEQFGVCRSTITLIAAGKHHAYV